MKYYLGYSNNYTYKPIISEKIGDNLKSIVEYTTSFSSISKIKDALVKEGLIPNRGVRIDYVIAKGPKNNKTYHTLNSTNEIYTSDSKKYFEPSSLKMTIDSEIDSSDFVVLLNSKYIKKYGYVNSIFSYLRSLDEETLKSVLVNLSKICLSSKTKNAIEDTISFLDKNSCAVNYNELSIYLESIMDSIKNDPYDITNSFTFFKKYINFRPIPAMNYLYRCLLITINEATNIDGYLDPHEELETKESVITKFFNEIVYDFDYVKKEYKKENGKRKINYREMFDLGAIVEEYFRNLYADYVDSIQETVKTYVIEEQDTSTDDEEEEFLEEADFERMGTSSEENGYNLRRRED